MSRAKNLANFQTTITDGTTSVATSTAIDAAKNRSAKVWCNWNGTGTAVIRDSLGVSSFIDNDAGDFTFSYTSSFASANYTTGGHHAHSSAITEYVYHVQLREDSAATASNARLLTLYVGATASGKQNYPNCNFTSHGDLA